MNHDWASVIVGIASAARWPVFLLVLWWMVGRETLPSLLADLGRRVQKLNIAGSGVDFAASTQQANSARELDPGQPVIALGAQTRREWLIPATRRGDFQVVEDQIRTHLETVPPQHREGILVQALSYYEVAQRFEILYRLIFGSQLNLLGQLTSSSSAPLADARSYYEVASKEHKQQFAGYSFDQWLRWLTDDASLVQTIENDQLVVTTDGREFMRYLITIGLPRTKAL